jgi:hypothetical protein
VRLFPSSWSESEFEKWFVNHPTLPNGERLFIINRQRALHHVVDLMALDQHGGLVIIEVKNERSTRAAIGQSLEYLAQAVETSIEDLADEYAYFKSGSALVEDFQNTYTHPLELSPQRRVFLVAPSFDFHTCLCVRYLHEHLGGASVEFGLIRAWRIKGGFHLDDYKCPPFAAVGKIKDGFAMTPGGRLCYILEPGKRPLVWYIGKRKKANALQPTSGRRLTYRSLDVLTRVALPGVPSDEVDVALCGTTWQHVKKPGSRAKLLGQVRVGDVGSGQRLAVFARFDDGVFSKFQRKPWGEFSTRWAVAEIELPGWKAIAEAARDRSSAR